LQQLVVVQEQQERQHVVLEQVLRLEQVLELEQP
jgi:hypothetical protein